MTTPNCGVNADSDTTNGVNVAALTSTSIRLSDTAGVTTWSITCIDCDDSNDATTITQGLSIDHTAKTATFTSPGEGSALIFQSVVNGGRDINGAVNPAYTTTFGIYVLIDGLRVLASNETLEGSSGYGWAKTINEIARHGWIVSAIQSGTTYSASVGELVRCDDTSNNITVSLPSAVGAAGRSIQVKRISNSANEVSVAAFGAETINGADHQTLSTQWETLYLVSDGENWLA